MMLKGGWIIGAVLVVVVMGFLTPSYAQDGNVNISILYTGDTQGHLESFYFDSEKPVGGVAKRAIYFQEKRRHKSMGWLTLDAGDAISGTALSNVFQGYLDIQAMNRLNYDAMVLGVHEFDYGVDVLRQRMAEAEFPVLCANIVQTDTGQPFATPYTIVERQGARIAIIGLTTNEAAARIAAENFRGLQVQDPVDVARSYIPQLTQQADIIVALTHQGVSEDIRLASHVPELNVIVGGMSHSELHVPMKVGNTLIVHDGYYGKSVGLLKLSYARLNADTLERKYFDCRLEPMAGLWVENSNYVDWLKSYQPQLIERMGLLVGNAAMNMPDLKLKSAETELGNYVCDILRQQTNADAALLPAGFFTAGLSEGQITLGDLYRSMPFNHYAVVLTVSGGELQEILNDAADNIGKPGFPQVSGLNFGIVNGNAYQIKVNGADLDPFGTYRLVTSDAVADGGFGYSAMGEVVSRGYTGRVIRDLVRERLATGQVASASLYSRIMFLAQEPERAQQPTSTGSVGQPPAQNTPVQPPVEEPAQQPAVEPPAQPPVNDTPPAGDGNRYDRNGDPMDSTVTIDEEVIDDPGSEGTDTTPPADEPVEEPAVETPPAQPEQPAQAAQTPGQLGAAVANANGLDYRFTVAPGGGGFVFKLEIGNTGSNDVDLTYLTGERFDFFVYQGQDLRWNHNHNRFFVQVEQTETIRPGEVITYTGEWNGVPKDRLALNGENLRFEAAHLVSGQPVRMEFNASIPSYTPPELSLMPTGWYGLADAMNPAILNRKLA